MLNNTTKPNFTCYEKKRDYFGIVIPHVKLAIDSNNLSAVVFNHNYLNCCIGIIQWQFEGITFEESIATSSLDITSRLMFTDQ